MLGFDSYADIAARLDDVAAGRPVAAAPAAGPAHAAAGHARSNARRRAAEVAVPGHAWLPAGAARSRLDRRAGGPPEAGLRLRPALHVLRDPVVPRLVRLPAAGRRAGRGEVAGRRRRPRAGAGQRELDLLRQGPRRPARAGEAAAAAGRGRRHRPGPGVLPAAGRDASGAARDASPPRRASRRTSTCPSSTPARPCCAGCGASVGTDAFLELLGPGAGDRARRRRAQQRDRRVPGRDRGRRRRARALPAGGPPGRDRRVRLLRRGRHRGRRLRRQAATPRRSPSGSRGSARWPTSWSPSAPRTGSAPGSRCWSRASPDTASAAGRAAHQAPEVDGSVQLERRRTHPRHARSGAVVDSDGADLIAAPLGSPW